MAMDPLSTTWGSTFLNMTVGTSFGKTRVKKTKREILRETVHHATFTSNLKFIDDSSAVLKRFERTMNAVKKPIGDGSKEILIIADTDPRLCDTDLFPFHEMTDGVPKS